MTLPRVLVADPPWRFGDSLPGKKRGATKHYKTLTFEEIRDFAIPEVEDDAHLFLWRVSAMQEEALAVVRAWGFEPVSELVWVKMTTGGLEHFGMGRTVRLSHEVCVIGRRGRPPVRSNSIRSTFQAQVGRHSEKPDRFYERVEQLTFGPYVELFARRVRPGWIQYGDELPRHPAEHGESPKEVRGRRV